MTELTDEAVKALLDGATEGPWTVEIGNVPIADTGDYDGYCRLMAGGRIVFEQWGDDEQSEKDAKLAGAAPILARALLDARAERDRLRADQAREMRPETKSEHIARDMREGRFPEQSERQMVPVLASLPHEIQVWRSTDTLDHIGTWATTRFPPEAVTYVSKADAQAAVALVVQQAAERLEINRAHLNFEALLGLLRDKTLPEPVVTALSDWLDVIAAAIRALAPADGLAAVEALRVEARENAMQALASMGQAQEAYEAQLEAEAELAVAQQREAALSDPICVHVNMLRGTIAKPTLEQIIHLYGVDALCKALMPVIVREAEAAIIRKGGTL